MTQKDKNERNDLANKLEKALADVKFQLNNVEGWLLSNNYTPARIKAECLTEASQELEKVLKEIEAKNTGEQDPF
jgi:CHASE3 domain sensor protein